jgi:hypothetical protein
MDSVEKPSTLLGGHIMRVIAQGRHRRGRDLATAYAWNVLRTLRARQWALASSGWITLLGVEHLPSASPPRLLLVFGFVLFCPGLAIAGLLPTQEIAERWVLGVALSMACGLLVSVAFTVMRDGSPTGRLGSLALITTIAVLVDAVVSARGHTSIAPADEKVQR